MDDRLTRLIAVREVHCTLRKQDQKLTWWWRERLRDYNVISARPDRDKHAAVLDRLFTMLKFVASPNNETRKWELIHRDWTALEQEVAPLRGE